MGGAIGGIQGAHKPIGEANSEITQLRDAVKENTTATKTSSKMMGGGATATTSLSIVEREWAVYQMGRGNVVGVGQRNRFRLASTEASGAILKSNYEYEEAYTLLPLELDLAANP